MSSSADSAHRGDAGSARALEQHTFDKWLPVLRALFDGAALASKIGFTASLITCDAGGGLRTSLLGIGELYAPDAGSLAFALWPSSRAARTLASQADEHGMHTSGSHRAHANAGVHEHRRARAALTFVHDEAFYQVQLAVAVMRDSGAEGSGRLAQFIASIDTGERQQVGYARLTSGLAFELAGTAREHEAVLARWQGQIDDLRQAAHAALAAGLQPLA